MKLRCPSCQTEFSTKAAGSGKAIRCPSCREIVRASAGGKKKPAGRSKKPSEEPDASRTLLIVGAMAGGVLLVGLAVGLAFVLRSRTSPDNAAAVAAADPPKIEAAPVADQPAPQPMPVVEQAAPAEPLIPPPEGELERLEGVQFADIFGKERLDQMTASASDSLTVRNRAVWVHTATYTQPDDPTGLQATQITTRQFGIRDRNRELSALRRQQTGGRIKESVVIRADGSVAGPDIHIAKTATGESRIAGNWLGALESQSVAFAFQQSTPGLSGHFVDQLPEGSWVSRYDNGKLRVGGSYLKGQRHGRFVVHDDQGRRIWSGIYENGSLVRHERHQPGDEIATVFLESEASRVEISSSGNRVATVHRETVFIWNAESGAEIVRFPVRLDGAMIESLEILADGNLLLVVLKPDGPGPVTHHLFRAETGELIADGLLMARFSPGGQWLAAFRPHQPRGNDLVLWDVSTGRIAAEIDGTRPAPGSNSGRAVIGYTDFAFSPSAEYLAVYSKDQIDIFDLPTGQRTQSLNVGLATNFPLTFCGDGRRLLGVTRRNNPVFIDLVTGTASGLSLPDLHNVGLADRSPKAMGLSADGRFLAAVWKTFSAMQIHVIDLSSGLCVLDRAINGLDDLPRSADRRGREVSVPDRLQPLVIEFRQAAQAGNAPFGKANPQVAPRREVVQATDWTLRIYDVAARDQPAIVADPPTTPAADPPPAGPFAEWRELVTRVNSLKPLRIAAGQGPEALPGGSWDFEPEYTTPCFNAAGTRLIIGGKDGVVRHWQSNGQPGTDPLAIRVQSGAFLPDQEHLFVFGDNSGNIGTWDLSRNKFIAFERSQPVALGAVRSVAVSPDRKLVASVDGDGESVRLFDPKTRKEVRKVTGLPRDVLGVAFHPDLQQLASYSESAATLIDPDTGALTPVQDVKTSRVIGIVPLPAPSTWLFLHCSAPPATLIRCSAADPMTSQSIPIGGNSTRLGYPTVLAAFHGGNHIAVGDYEGAIALVDTQDGAIVKVLRGHLSAVTGLAISSDDRFLVSTSRDRTIRAWGADEFPFNLIAPSGDQSAPDHKASSKSKARLAK